MTINYFELNLDFLKKYIPILRNTSTLICFYLHECPARRFCFKYHKYANEIYLKKKRLFGFNPFISSPRFFVKILYYEILYIMLLLLLVQNSSKVYLDAVEQTALLT